MVSGVLPERRRQFIYKRDDKYGNNTTKLSVKMILWLITAVIVLCGLIIDDVAYLTLEDSTYEYDYGWLVVIHKNNGEESDISYCNDSPIYGHDQALFDNLCSGGIIYFIFSILTIIGSIATAFLDEIRFAGPNTT
eukprot:UN00211